MHGGIRVKYNIRPHLDLILIERQDQEVSFPKPLQEFDVDFSFSQQVHVVRRKLSHAHLILDNTLATIDSLRTLAVKVTQLIVPPDSVVESFQCKLQDLSGELRNLRQTSRKLLLQSEDINLMVNIPPIARRFPWPGSGIDSDYS